MHQTTTPTNDPDGGPAEPEALLSPKQLAGYLGVPVSTIYQWRYRGEGPAGIKFGNHVRYRWSQVQDWLRQHTETQPGR